MFQAKASTYVPSLFCYLTTHTIADVRRLRCGRDTPGLSRLSRAWWRLRLLADTRRTASWCASDLRICLFLRMARSGAGRWVGGRCPPNPKTSAAAFLFFYLLFSFALLVYAMFVVRGLRPTLHAHERYYHAYISRLHTILRPPSFLLVLTHVASISFIVVTFSSSTFPALGKLFFFVRRSNCIIHHAADVFMTHSYT
jgi:hypothetical protein